MPNFVSELTFGFYKIIHDFGQNFQGYVILVKITKFAIYLDFFCGILKRNNPNKKKTFLRNCILRFNDFVEADRLWRPNLWFFKDL